MDTAPVMSPPVSPVRKRKRSKVIPRILIGLALLAVVAWLVVGAVAANKLTVPERLFDESRTPATYGMVYEDVSFTSRDGKTSLEGWYIPSEANERVIVFVHGRDASRTAAYGSGPDEFGNQPVPGRLLEFVSKLNQAGYSVFIFDLRGHGQSGDGRFSFGVYERLDALAALDWLKAKGYQPGRIGMMGLSLGAAASIGAAAADPDVGVLVTDSTFAALTPVVKRVWVEESGLPMVFMYSTQLMIRIQYGWNMDAVRPVDEIIQVAPRPVMLIHCQDDEQVLVSQAEQLMAAVPTAQTWVLPHCIHGQTYNADPETFAQKVIGFFDANIK